MTSSLTRLGSANTYDNALRNLSMRQSALSNLQENLTSGKKVVRASDDPTGAAQATIRALPQLAGLFDGVAIRAPIGVGSIADIVVVTARPTSVEEVNAVFTEEAQTPRYQGILGVSEDPMVSSDIVGDPRASVVNLDLTQVVDGTLVKIMAWYDNEWGFTNQMIREARATLGLSPSTESISYEQ